MMKFKLAEDQMILNFTHIENHHFSERDPIWKEALKSTCFREFCVEISHEINNPLMILLGKSFQLRRELSKQGMQAEEINKLLDDLDRTTERISEAVIKMRQFSEQNSGHPLQFR
jgi:signal transduction histidine kinase